VPTFGRYVRHLSVSERLGDSFNWLVDKLMGWSLDTLVIQQITASVTPDHQRSNKVKNSNKIAHSALQKVETNFGCCIGHAVT
jgi:hypothetical protein